MKNLSFFGIKIFSYHDGDIVKIVAVYILIYQEALIRRGSYSRIRYDDQIEILIIYANKSKNTRNCPKKLWTALILIKV